MKAEWSQSRREAAFYLKGGSVRQPRRSAIPLISVIFFLIVIGIYYHG